MLNLLKIKNEQPVAEYKSFIKLRIISIITFGLLLIGFVGMVVFVGSNVYSAINQIQSIIILDSKLGMETINFDLFEKVKNAWEEKQSDGLPAVSRDPFNP